METSRLDAGRVQDRDDVVEQPRLKELAIGKVDADRDRCRPVTIQVMDTLAGLRQHPPADRHDQAGLLRDRDELARRHVATRRVAPTNQRLERLHTTAAQVDDRLVCESELFPGKGAAQVGLDLEA